MNAQRIGHTELNCLHNGMVSSPFSSSEDPWWRIFESLCQDSAVDHSACEEAAQEVANPSSPVRHSGAYFMFNRKPQFTRARTAHDLSK